MEQRTLYWAYGSNLNVAQMRRRCPDARKGSQLIVSDAALVFRSCADVTIRKGSFVPGGLWHITRECEKTLDRYEGAGNKFYLKRYLPVTIDGRKHQVLFYQLRATRGIMPPSAAYADVIAEGYRDFGLNEKWLDLAIAESYDCKEVTHALLARHSRKGYPQLVGRPKNKSRKGVYRI
jgi:hypothetical protein